MLYLSIFYTSIRTSGKLSRVKTYAHILINGLLNKNAIKEAGYVRSGKTFGRLYAANISCQEYYAKNVFAGSKEVLPMLFSALIQSDGISPELINELENMLEKRKKELE